MRIFLYYIDGKILPLKRMEAKPKYKRKAIRI